MTAIAPHASPHVANAPAAPPGGEAPLPAFRGWHVAVLFAVTVLGALLRLYKLEAWSFWVDEAHTWRDVTMPLWRFRESARGWYPVSYLGLRGLMDSGVLPMFSEGWLRLPFALFGIASVPLLALFGQLLVGRRAALLAALFLAINPWHIYWSQNARAYVLVFFLAVLAAGTFWVGVRRRSWWWIGVGVLSMFLAGGCHFTGLSLMPVFLAYPLLSRRNLTGRRIAAGVAIAVGVATVLPYVLALMPPFQAFQRAKPDASLLHMVQTTVWYFRLPLLVAAFLGTWLLCQNRMQGRALFLACWGLIPLLVLGMVGTSVVKVTARYALCALPAVLLLAGAGSIRMAEVLATGLGRATMWSRAVPALVLPVILCFDMASYDFLYYTVQYGDRGRYREAAEFVMQDAGDQRAAVVTVNEPSLLYYLRPNHFRRENDLDPERATIVMPIESWDVFPDPDRPETAGHNGVDYLKSVRRGLRDAGRKMFVVITLPELQEKDLDGSLRRGLDELFELAAVLPCWVGPKDETIYVYRARD